MLGFNIVTFLNVYTPTMVDEGVNACSATLPLDPSVPALPPAPARSDFRFMANSDRYGSRRPRVCQNVAFYSAEVMTEIQAQKTMYWRAAVQQQQQQQEEGL